MAWAALAAVAVTIARALLDATLTQVTGTTFRDHVAAGRRAGGSD
jgi:hypothetical protein